MRAIIAAIALVFTIGVALPTPTDARPPRKIQKWGCAFEAHKPWFEATPDDPYVPWAGIGAIEDCDKRQRFTIRLAIVEDVPGAANRIHSRRKTTRKQNKGPGIWHVIMGGQCTANGAAPTRNPVYTRMQVKRVGKPGVVRVASRSNRNPCRGVEKFPWLGAQ